MKLSKAMRAVKIHADHDYWAEHKQATMTVIKSTMLI